MPEHETFFDPEEGSPPPEEDVEVLRQKLLEAEEKAKEQGPTGSQEGKPVTDKDRQAWKDELDAMRASSRAKLDDELERRGSGRRESLGFVPRPAPGEKPEKKQVAVKVDEEEERE